MGGTITGGKLAAKKNKELYGSDFYQRVGYLGGSAKKTKPAGWAAMKPELRSYYGRIGGLKSKRGARV